MAAKDPNLKAIDDVASSLNKMMEKSFGGFAAESMATVASRELEMIPSDFLDLNRIVGGSLFAFMPAGNITVLAGKEASGKSLIGYNLMKNAQKMGYVPILVETENAITPKTIPNSGLNVAKGGMVMKLGYVEQCLIGLDHAIHEFVKKGIRPMIVLDSLGNLDIEKSVNDIKKGEIKQDMGLFQKTVKTMLKHICHLCSHHDIPFVIITHVFFDPSPYSGGVKIYGGQHLKFLANTTVFFSSAKKKDKTGFDLKALTMKNRLAPALQEAAIEIDIRTSQANRFAGLVEICKEIEVFPTHGSYLYVPHLDKKMYATEIYKQADEVFTQEFLQFLDEEIKSRAFNTITFADGDLGQLMTAVEKGVKLSGPAANADDVNEALLEAKDLFATGEPEVAAEAGDEVA